VSLGLLGVQFGQLTTTVKKEKKNISLCMSGFTRCKPLMVKYTSDITKMHPAKANVTAPLTLQNMQIYRNEILLSVPQYNIFNLPSYAIKLY